MQTFQNTMHHIKTLEGETREYMRDYHHALCPRHLNDTLFVDCFFSQIRPIRGFQMHALKQSKLSLTTNLKREEDAPNTYQDFIIDNGAPNKTCTDNAQLYFGQCWKWTYSALPKYSNYAEGKGEIQKYWLVKLLHLTPHAPSNYWRFGLYFLNTVRKCLLKNSLNGHCPAEMVKKETFVYKYISFILVFSSLVLFKKFRFPNRPYAP